MKNLPTSTSSTVLNISSLSVNTQKSSKGFTLIELLVAISIVAILSTIGITVFGGVQVRSRDAKRSGDLSAIANALEGKKQAGSIFYTALVAIDFAGGLVPTDPRSATQQYCIWGTTSIPPVAGISNPTVASVNWTTCAGPTADYTAVVGAGVPPTATQVTSFTICAKQESVTGGIECRSSRL